MENNRAICLSMFIPPYSDATLPTSMYTDIDRMLGDEAAQHEYFTLMFTSRNANEVENLERRLTLKGLYVSSNPCNGQYRGLKKLCTVSRQQMTELNVPEINTAINHLPVISSTDPDVPKDSAYPLHVIKYSRAGLKNFTVNELLRHLYVTFRVRINIEQYSYFVGLMRSFKPSEYALTALFNDLTSITVMNDVYITTNLQNWGEILSQNRKVECTVGNCGLADVFESIQSRIDAYLPSPTVPIQCEVDEDP